MKTQTGQRARPTRRRTQEERRRATQDAILQAAIDLLAEEGYARFTTVNVARRAGVSRGARENYYHTKYELIAAAWRAALERVEQRSQGLASEIGLSSDPVGQYLSNARSFFLSRDYIAMLELGMAARTDPRLAGILHALFKDYRKRHDEIWIRVLEQSGYERRNIVKLIELTNCLLRGMALTGAWQLPQSQSGTPFDELERLAPILLSSPRESRS